MSPDSLSWTPKLLSLEAQNEPGLGFGVDPVLPLLCAGYPFPLCPLPSSVQLSETGTAALLKNYHDANLRGSACSFG